MAYKIYMQLFSSKLPLSPLVEEFYFIFFSSALNGELGMQNLAREMLQPSDAAFSCQKRLGSCTLYLSFIWFQHSYF